MSRIPEMQCYCDVICKNAGNVVATRALLLDNQDMAVLEAKGKLNPSSAGVKRENNGHDHEYKVVGTDVFLDGIINDLM